MSNGNGPAGGLPGIPSLKLSEADKAMVTLIRSRQSGRKTNLAACKCGNRALLRRELVEVAINTYPKMLGLPEDRYPEKEVAYNPLAEVFICPKCNVEVISHRLNKLTELKKGKDGKGKNRIENVEEHPSGGKRK